MAIIDILNAVVDFDKKAVVENVKTAVNREISIDEILNKGLIGAMDVVGEKFSSGEIFVPEMLQAAKAMQAGLEVLKPHLTGDAIVEKGTVLIGTVKGDLHDIGKNLVTMMVEGAGFNVIDLGVDVDTDKFISEAQAHDADVVCLSALLTTTMPIMAKTVEAFKETGLKAKIIIGGAPVTDAYAQQIGADGFSDNAPGAVELIRKLIAA
ncbi:MAG: cobalamin-binding protein [Deltaproteobacteria bacterium]|nr:MAG: cobalamin-binding protein [Deltaproteobacteria bacterium]RLC21055.1 MAG: cobalamin-binding protein [Deltaproteobacteria bacterium]